MDNNLYFYNLWNVTSVRNIKKALDNGITFENMKHMNERDFISIYGNTNHLLYRKFKSYATNHNPNLISLSIFALYHYGISNIIVNNLYRAGVVLVSSLLYLNEDELKYKYHIKGSAPSLVLEALDKMNITNEDIVGSIDNIKDIPKPLLKYFESLVYNSLVEFEPNKPEDIIKNIPPRLISIGLGEYIIDGLLKNNKIGVENGLFYKCHLTLKDFLNTLDDSRESECFKMHVSGKSLEEIGDTIGVTRERVRQIIKKVNIPILEENKYFKYYNEYDISTELFSKIFDIGIEETNYVFKYAKGMKGDKKLEDILDDESVSENIKDRVLKYVPFYIIDGNRVVANVTSLFKYYLFKYAKDNKPIPVLYDGFKNFLKDYEEEKEPSFSLFTNLFENSKSAILGTNGYRYFNYDNTDNALTEALNEIELSAYNNLEISTKVLFNAHKDIMESLDIRDGHELHMLMKRVGNYPNVTFGRTPMITIGLGDRNKQVLDLLTGFDGKNVFDFVKEYSRIYGVQENSFLSYFTTNYGKYIYNSKINLNIPEISEDEVSKLRNLLIEDYYLLSEVKDILFKNDIVFEQKYLYPNNLKKIGYIPYSQFIVKDSYGSAQGYFDSLFAKEIIDFKDSYKRYFWNLQFEDTLYNNLRENNIYQIDLRKYARESYLINKNITKDIINKFKEDVIKFVDKERLFTIYSIIKDGFTSEILNLTNNIYFLCGLLQYSKDFVFVRIGYTEKYIFKIKTNDSTIKTKDLIKQIIDDNGTSSVDDVVSYLNYYGISLYRGTLLEILKELKNNI